MNAWTTPDTSSWETDKVVVVWEQGAGGGAYPLMTQS
jgi:hypothetical protein